VRATLACATMTLQGNNMPLDKNDLKQISNIFDKKIDEKIDKRFDSLAMMISRGFSAMDERFDRIEKRMRLNRRVTILEKQVLKPR
jgi:hypothetical protein